MSQEDVLCSSHDTALPCAQVSAKYMQYRSPVPHPPGVVFLMIVWYLDTFRPWLASA